MAPQKPPDEPSARGERAPRGDEAPREREADPDRLLQKSESMAREHSQKREMKIRHDRVRHLSSEPEMQGFPNRREPSSSSSSSMGGSSSRNAVSGRVAAPTGRAAMIAEPPPPAAPAESRRTDMDSFEDRPVAPIVIGRPSMVDDVAIELEDLLREVMSGWRRSEAPDRITIVSAVFTLVGVLLPWVSDPAHPFQIGLAAGGVAHGALAITALVLLARRGRTSVDRRAVSLGRRELEAQTRRTSLWHILIGSLSTFLGAYFLLTYGLMRSPEWNIKIHFGLYWTLAWGLGLSYGGFARFLKRNDHVER